MREIKFRAWLRKEKVMYFSPEMGTEFDNRETICFWQYLEDMQVEIDDVILMQYTGLKDKNGKKIYEGDIVEIIHPCWHERCVTEFVQGSFIFRQLFGGESCIPGWTFMKENWEVKIIGNIKENIKLTKQK